MSRRSEGCFITFEGTEGSGKTTQIGRLANRLSRRGRSVVQTREPGGTEFGRRLRAVLLEPTDTPMDPYAELLLYAADRVQHLCERVLPALEQGAVVLCDRYLDATLAYQGYGRKLGTASVLELHRRAPLTLRPHRTVLIDMSEKAALLRAQQRNTLAGSEAEGRFELEALEFHRRVRDGYLALAAAEPERFRVIDGNGSETEVEQRILDALDDLFPTDDEPAP